MSAEVNKEIELEIGHVLLSIPYAGAFSADPLTLALLRLDPMFDPLRNDPRFQKLLRRQTEVNPRNFSAKLKRRNCAVAYAAAPGREFGKALTEK